jgi:hypothetical protein
MSKSLTFEEHLKIAEYKLSRKISGLNVDSLYPILLEIVKEGTKTWLEQKRKELCNIDNDVDEFIFQRLLEYFYLGN